MDATSRYDSMSRWDKFNLRVIRHPILRRFKRVHRCRIFELLSMACDWGNAGVIAQKDDEIADELDFASLADWMRMRELCLIYKVFRKFETAGGSMVYEINPLLLVRQEGDQRDESAFVPSAWDQPEAGLDSEAAEALNEGSLIPADVSTDLRKRILGAARKGYFDAVTRARKDGHPLPDRDAFMQAYLLNRLDREGISPAVSPDFGNAEGPESVTLVGNGNAPQTTRENTDREDNNRQNEIGAAVTLGSVTSESVTDVVVDSQSFSEDAIISGLVALGVSESSIREKCIPAVGLEECARQLVYYPHQPHTEKHETPGGFLYGAIMGRWAAPPGYHKMVRKREHRAVEQTRAAAAAVKQAAADQQREADEARCQSWWEAASEIEQTEVTAQAKQIFQEKQASIYKRFMDGGAEQAVQSQMVTDFWLRFRNEVIRGRW